MSAPIAPATYTAIPSVAWQQIVMQHAINALTCNKRKKMNLVFTPAALLPSVVKHAPSHIKHFVCQCSPLHQHDHIQLQKGNEQSCDITSLADQGKDKTGQKGTNAMLVMLHDEIKHVL
jgi:hypothetical protein